MADDTLELVEVVTAFLEYKGDILLVQRSGKVGSYQGSWSAISGYLEDATHLEQALREIREETSLSAEEVHLMAQGEPIKIAAPELSRVWQVHPFLFRIDNPEHIRLDWENVDYRWVAPDQIKNFSTVPKLEEALHSCLERG